MSPATPAKVQKKLEALLAVPENTQCADCCEAKPKYTSVCLGIFLCARCSHLHTAKLGATVKHVKTDIFSDAEVENMSNLGGNRKSNAIFLGVAGGAGKISSSSVEGEASAYIKRKYKKKEWVRAKDLADAESRMSNLSTSSSRGGSRDGRSPSNSNAIVEPGDKEKYSKEIQMLAGMGFSNVKMCIIALKKAKGNVDAAVEVLVAMPPIEDDVLPSSKSPENRGRSGTSSSSSKKEEKKETLSTEEIKQKLREATDFLRGMGFTDDLANLEALKAAEGDLDKTVELLVAQSEKTGTTKQSQVADDLLSTGMTSMSVSGPPPSQMSMQNQFIGQEMQQQQFQQQQLRQQLFFAEQQNQQNMWTQQQSIQQPQQGFNQNIQPSTILQPQQTASPQISPVAAPQATNPFNIAPVTSMTTASQSFNSAPVNSFQNMPANPFDSFQQQPSHTNMPPTNFSGPTQLQQQQSAKDMFMMQTTFQQQKQQEQTFAEQPAWFSPNPQASQQQQQQQAQSHPQQNMWGTDMPNSHQRQATPEPNTWSNAQTSQVQQAEPQHTSPWGTAVQKPHPASLTSQNSFGATNPFFSNTSPNMAGPPAQLSTQSSLASMNSFMTPSSSFTPQPDRQAGQNKNDIMSLFNQPPQQPQQSPNVFGGSMVQQQPQQNIFGGSMMQQQSQQTPSVFGGSTTHQQSMMPQTQTIQQQQMMASNHMISPQQMSMQQSQMVSLQQMNMQQPTPQNQMPQSQMMPQMTPQGQQVMPNTFQGVSTSSGYTIASMPSMGAAMVPKPLAQQNSQQTIQMQQPSQFQSSQGVVNGQYSGQQKFSKNPFQ